MTQAWSMVEYRGFEGLRRLEADWQLLFSAMPDRAPHHAYETHRAYFNHVSRADGRFTCLALTDGERVRAICPLEPETVEILGRRTRVMGLPWHLYDFGRRDVICPPGDARRRLLPSLIRYLRDRPDRPRSKWLVFSFVPEGSALWECLHSLDSRSYCTDVAGASDMIDCQMPFEDLTSALSKNFRGNLRKARNKLAALADVRFVNAVDPASVEREFETFLEVEASGWKGEAAVRGAIRQKPEQLAFYRDLAQGLHDLARFEVNTLYAEGRCIASQLCVRAGAEYVIPKICYDERYARTAPGQLLLMNTLERCCRDPEIRWVNLVSNAEWHQDFGPSAAPEHFVYVGLGAWSGRPLVGLQRLRLTYGPRVKRWLLRIKAGARDTPQPRSRGDSGPSE